MKITKTQLRQIIKEELLKEAGRPHSMRSGRSMSDLDSEAETRETDFLNKPDKESALRQIVGDKQAGKVDGDIVDLFSASAILSVLDALSDANREKFMDLPVGAMANLAFKMLK